MNDLLAAIDSSKNGENNDDKNNNNNGPQQMRSRSSTVPDLHYSTVVATKDKPPRPSKKGIHHRNRSDTNGATAKGSNLKHSVAASQLARSTKLHTAVSSCNMSAIFEIVADAEEYVSAITTQK